MHPVADLSFYAVAVPAVALAGLSKGGFGGAMGMLAVPLMALVISPLQAAGIMLPILVSMDLVGVIAYRGNVDRKSLLILLPPAVLGIAIGWATAAMVDEAFVRLLVGVISLLFVADYFFRSTSRSQARDHNRLSGSLWGGIAGFTSFVSHTGGPPFQLYMMPRRFPPTLFAGTAAIFFASVNAIKLVPYFMLGQFDADNLLTSAILLPLAPLSTLAGVWLVRIVQPAFFYKFLYVVMGVVGVKLVYDGINSLFLT